MSAVRLARCWLKLIWNTCIPRCLLGFFIPEFLHQNLAFWIWATWIVFNWFLTLNFEFSIGIYLKSKVLMSSWKTKSTPIPNNGFWNTQWDEGTFTVRQGEVGTSQICLSSKYKNSLFWRSRSALPLACIGGSRPRLELVWNFITPRLCTPGRFLTAPMQLKPVQRTN